MTRAIAWWTSFVSCDPEEFHSGAVVMATDDTEAISVARSVGVGMDGGANVPGEWMVIEIPEDHPPDPAWVGRVVRTAEEAEAALQSEVRTAGAWEAEGYEFPGMECVGWRYLNREAGREARRRRWVVSMQRGAPRSIWVDGVRGDGHVDEVVAYDHDDTTDEGGAA